MVFPFRYRLSLAVVLLLGSGVLASCDFASAGSTAVLNAQSAVPPTVEYTFNYTSNNVGSDGRIEVVSQGSGTPTLETVLSRNGFSRSDVVSARVDSVMIERLSGPTFDYLTRADVYLGTSADGTHIGSGELPPNEGSTGLDVPSRSVTSLVKQGSPSAFARLEITQPEDVPTVDRVRVTVYYRIEVGGV